MATEYEWKFQATPVLLNAIDVAFPSPTEHIRMETTYFDTPTEALSSRRYTLRKRLENNRCVCTLKAPAGAAREEWELECNCIESAIHQLLALGCPADFGILTQEGIIPVCGAKFTRIAKTLSFPEGIIELALDSGFLIGGNRQEPLCEVEVELKSGSAELCDTFAKTLADRFQLKLETRSKFRRAFALYRGQ